MTTPTTGKNKYAVIITVARSLILNISPEILTTGISLSAPIIAIQSVL